MPEKPSSSSSNELAAPTPENPSSNSSGGLGARFTHFSKHAASATGSPWSFIIALAAIIIWGALGPQYHYSDTWQLVINTATTIVTFLMVFIIQNTQNRDTKAIHLKLDEIIRSHRQSKNAMIDIEKLSDEELERLAKQYEAIRAACDERQQSNSDPANSDPANSNPAG
jgi:low affinity Fe/Cu permease